MTEVYDRSYFEGDDQTRGYRAEGYRDFAAHYATAEAVLSENPESVIEIGAGRGYIMKIVEAGAIAESTIPTLSMDISPHCYHTRAVENFMVWDITKIPWMQGFKKPIEDKAFDLSFSIAILEHIPEDKLNGVIKEIARVSRRGLHAPSLEQKGAKDTSHETMHDLEWWQARFAVAAPDFPVKIVNKEDFELHGDMNKIIERTPKLTRAAGAGCRVEDIPKLKKIQFGSFLNMFYYGWLNSDIQDLQNYAASQGYNFMRIDTTKPLPFPNEYADLIFSSHLIEHLSRDEGVRFMAECSRILKPGGCIRIATPNIRGMMRWYNHDTDLWYKARENDRKARYDLNSDDPDGLARFRHVNVGVAGAPTPIDAFANLALSGHKSIYDEDALRQTMEHAGLKPIQVVIREEKKNGKRKKWSGPVNAFVSSNPIMERETIVSHPTLSLVMEGTK